MAKSTATHWANKKPKSKSQMEYEARVKKSNAKLAKDPLLQGMIGLSPLALPLAVDKGIKTGEWGEAALEGAGALAGPLAGGAIKAGKNLVKNADMIAPALTDLDYTKLLGREVLGMKGPQPKSVGASARYDEPIPRLTNKEEQAAQMLGPDGRRIVADMKREAKNPSISKDNPTEGLKRIRGQAPLSYKGPGAHPMDYRRYKTPLGDWVHSTYDPKGNVQNVLGGKGPTLEKGYAKTLGGVNRPSGAFRPITDAMIEAGYPVRRN